MKRFILSISILLIVILCYSFTFKKVETYRDMNSYNRTVFYLPPYELLDISSAGFQEIFSEFLLFKTIVYYGEMLMKGEGNVNWEWMHKSFDASSRLDPYNIDTYYISQALLSWEGGMYKEATEILKRGMEYRKWDWYMPFFIGFNYFYFFKDDNQAAEYYKIGARLNPQFIQLAAKMYERADRAEFAVLYLKGALNENKNPVIRKGIENRIISIENNITLNKAIKGFEERFKRMPTNLEEMVKEGVLSDTPKDPYGKVYKVNEKGEVVLEVKK